jgi:hypothetical protein
MLRRISAFVFAAALPVLASCADHVATPLAPEVAPAAALVVGDIDLDGVVEFVTLPDLTQNRHASRYIRAAEGGSVQLNGFRVDIPAGALPTDTLITIDLPTDAVLGKRVIAEFGPHGIQFNTPVTITFPLSGTILTPGGLHVGRWENGAWTNLGGTVDVWGHSISSTTPHFSVYGARKDVVAGG